MSSIPKSVRDPQEPAIDTAMEDLARYDAALQAWVDDLEDESRKLRGTIDALRNVLVSDFDDNDSVTARLTRIEAMLTQSLSADSKSWFALGQDVREVKAMLQKITQAPSITRGPGPLDISVTTEDGRTASIKTVYPSADDLRRAWEKGVDPHTDDTETERALRFVDVRAHGQQRNPLEPIEMLKMIERLSERVEKLEEWKGVRDSWCEGGPWGG